MTRTRLTVGAVTTAACLWASGSASALTPGCSTAVNKILTDVVTLRSAYVAYGTDLAARNPTQAAVDKAAASAALSQFTTDLTAFKLACAAG